MATTQRNPQTSFQDFLDADFLLRGNGRIKLGKYYFQRTNHGYVVQHNDIHKGIFVELLKRENSLPGRPNLQKGNLEYRFSYFIYTPETDSWKRSIHCALIPPKELKKLIKQVSPI